MSILKVMAMSVPLFTSYFDSIKVALDDPTFLQRTFSLIAKQRKRSTESEEDEIKKIVEEEFDALSKWTDRAKMQDSAAVRGLARVRKLVARIINDKGEIDKLALGNAIELIKNSLYSLGPDRQSDTRHQEQLLSALVQLNESKEMQILLKNISAPYMNRYAEKLIKETLQLPPNSRVNDPEARRAALSMWLCLLRQSVGSCFATAPAIIVHDHQAAVMFKDLVELLATSRLKRIFAGVEHSVPLTSSWGAGELRRPIVLQHYTPEEMTDICSSPGLLAALEAAGLIEAKLSAKERLVKAKALLVPFLQEDAGGGAIHTILSAEELLKMVILTALKMTPEDLQEQESTPKAAIAGAMMMQVAASGGGKVAARTNFYAKFEAACTAFKSIADNALLKSWEFTLASFAETKTNFARWNLYSSLGLQPEEPGGIGYVIYTTLQTKLEQLNREAEDIKIEYEQKLTHLRYLETRMRTGGGDKESEWLKSEYRTRRYEFEIIEERHNRLQVMARRYSNLMNVLVDFYTELFPKFFQEVYDPDMHEISVGPYDDSPAGFRLLYKHGRANTAQWTRIKTPGEFIEALASFFVSTEMEISTDPEMEGLERELSDLTTAIVMQIRTPEFLETAFHRMARAHHVAPIKNPLENLDRIDKKPWAYTSGGTMGSLVSNYWKREQPPTEMSRWVENPAELLVFLVDTMKLMPSKVAAEFESNPKKSLLIHSPTHAFLLKPGLRPFMDLWKSPEFTYTHIRDTLIKPAENFVSRISLTQDMAQYLIEQLTKKVPVNFQYYFRQTFAYVPVGVSPAEFRHHLIHVMAKERGLAFGRVLPGDEIDSLLYTHLPLFPGNELKERVETIFKKLPNVGPRFLSMLETMWEELPISMSPGLLVSAHALREIVKGILCLLYGTTSTPYDYHLHVSHICQKLGYAMPTPVIVADTNWVRDDFGFVVNPGTEKFEFWRVDYTGSIGYPMSVWDQWLNGSKQEPKWGVYTNPYEYTM